MCGSCSDCPFQKMDEDIYHQIHITVGDKTNREQFTKDCIALGLKPLFIYDFREPVGRWSIMTSSTVKNTTNHKANLLMFALASEILTKGYDVVRCKVETSPNNISALKEDMIVFDKSRYLESHIKVLGDGTPIKNEMNAFLKQLGLARSQNMQGDPNEFMLTLRWYNNDLENFNHVSNMLIKSLEPHFKKVYAPIVEYTMYDNNINYDKGWL
jgi:hypothetical protein